MSKVYPKTYPKTYAKVYGKVNPPVSTIYPSNIASNTEWWDIQDLSTMWQESSKTTPAAVDQPIGYIESKTGSGNDFQQSVAAKRPILRHDGTSYYLEGNGTMYMAIPSSTASFKYLHNSQGGMLFAGVRRNDSGTLAVILGNAWSSAHIGFRLSSDSGNNLNLFLGRGTAGTPCIDHTGTNGLFTKNINHLVTQRFDVAETPDINVTTDGVDDEFNPSNSANAGSATLDLALFENSTLGNAIPTGRFYGSAFFNETLSANDDSNMRLYYNSILGL